MTMHHNGNAVKQNNNVVFVASTLQEAQQTYNDWCKSYDEDMENAGFANTPETAGMFEKHALKSKAMLDIASGTGGVIQILRKKGYEGEVDVLDCNMEMLTKAQQKLLNIRNVFKHLLDDNGILPLKDESYDAVTCAGAFAPNHIPATALKGILLVLKKHGFFITTARSGEAEEYKMEFDRVVQELVKAGNMEIVDSKEYDYYSKTHTDSPKSTVYVFRRL